jgi:hypothetical protein
MPILSYEDAIAEIASCITPVILLGVALIVFIMSLGV